LQVVGSRVNRFGRGRTCLFLATLLAALCAALDSGAAGLPRNAAAANAAHVRVVLADVAAKRLLAELNRVRALHGLRSLRASALLADAAAAHCRGMAVKGYFDHEPPAGRGPSFASRLEHYYPSRAGRAWAVGENILWASKAPTARGAVAAFMRSPGHRANILDPRWREIGVAVVDASHAPGVYGGRSATIITTDFGVR
jgi:uncharacterized protein YkwD